MTLDFGDLVEKMIPDTCDPRMDRVVAVVHDKIKQLKTLFAGHVRLIVELEYPTLSGYN